MSEENVDLVREILDAWNAEDLDRWLACWDASCVWVPGMRSRMEGSQTYRGHEGLRRYWAEDADVWERFLVEVHEVRTKGPEVVAITTGRARGKHSEVETSASMAFRFRVRNRKILRAESYLDVGKALEAVGLSE